MDIASFPDICVAVIIPAFNAERFVDATLRSVVNQSHVNLDIIVIDDGSQDGTAAICREFAARDQRVRVVSTENRGVAAARNLGVEMTRADYIAFIDADDLWHPAYVDTLLMALHPLPPEWGAVYALHRFIDEDGQCTRSGSSLSSRGYIFARHLVFRFIGNGSAFMVRRAVIDRIGGYDPSYAEEGRGGCEDFDFEIRTAMHFKIEAIPLGLVGYRIHDERMSSDKGRMARSLIEATRRSIAAYPDLPSFVVRAAWASTHLYAFWRFADAREWALSLRSLASIFRYSRSLSLRIVLHFAISKINRQMADGRKLFGSRRRASRGKGHHFHEVDLAAPLGEGHSYFRTEALLNRLAEADSLLARTRWTA